MDPGRPARIGLVLGGGGLTGTAFHAGVIAGLEQAAGWDARTAEILVGTSAGSTSAALLRAGLPPQDFVARMVGAPLTARGHEVLGGMGPLRSPERVGQRRRAPAAPRMLGQLVLHPRRVRPGLIAAALLPVGALDVGGSVARITDLFRAWPEEPLWVCAVRLDDGQRVVFGRDAQASLSDAVSASCAIPGYYSPVEISGSRYVDGGMWSTHNADLLAGLGLDLVIISAPMSSAHRKPSDRGSLLRMPIRHGLDRQVRVIQRSGTPVVVIQPDSALASVMGTSTMRLARRGPVAQATRAHVMALVAAGEVPHLGE